MRNEIVWNDRKFKFDMPIEMFVIVVERLRGMPARLEDKLKFLPGEILKHREGDSWSIFENARHLVDVEPLWDRRLDDFLAGEKTLAPASKDSLKRREANVNLTSIDDILKAFREARQHIVGRFDSLSARDVAITAMHPRLNQPMRIIDHAIFMVEHDDHHMARMTDIIRELVKSK